MLSIINYKKAYGHIPVLVIPRFEIPGGFYWLKGENGAGKTTFLKSVAGMIPFEGEMIVDGIHLRRHRQLYTKNVAFAEAEPVYPSFLTGNDLLRFYELTRGKNEQIREKLIAGLGMQTYLANKVGTYSSGMLKKLSLLLVFSGKPALILLDEPFITLDADAVKFLQDHIAGCQKEAASFIISSHQDLSLPAFYTTLHIYQKSIREGEHAAVE